MKHLLLLYRRKQKLEEFLPDAIIAVIGMIVSILIQGIVSDWMDILSIYICPLGAGLAGIVLLGMWKTMY